MTKSLLFTIAALLLLLPSCKKDSNNNSSISITGKWHWVEQTYDSYTDDKLTNHEEYTTTLDPLSYFEFDADGTFIENPQDHNGNYLYGKYHITGNMLYIKGDADVNLPETVYTIKTLTSTKLVIHETTGQAPYRGEVEYTMKR